MPAGSTYSTIATTTLGSNSTEVNFSSISSSYTDLVLVANFKNTTSVDMFMRFNGDTGNNYSATHLYGNGTSALSTRYSNTSTILLDLGANGFGTEWGTYTIQMMNYSNTTTNKTVLNRASFAGIYAGSIVGLWRNTSAINAIRIWASTNDTIATGSTFTLYGIAAA